MSSVSEPDCDFNIEMIDVCYNLFMILMAVDLNYWGHQSCDNNRHQETLTRIQTVNTLEVMSGSETEIHGQKLGDFTPHHKLILFHPSSSAIDFLAPAYIK